MDVVRHVKVHALEDVKEDVTLPARTHALENVLVRVMRAVIPHVRESALVDAVMGAMTHVKVHVLERAHHRVEQVVRTARAHVLGVMAVVVVHVLVAPLHVVCHVVPVAHIPVAPVVRQDVIRVVRGALDALIVVFRVVVVVWHLAMSNVKIIARVAREHVRAVHRHAPLDAREDAVDVVDAVHVISIVAHQLHNTAVAHVVVNVPTVRPAPATVMVRVRDARTDAPLVANLLLLQ